jgi:hypothetical protein
VTYVASLPEGQHALYNAATSSLTVFAPLPTGGVAVGVMEFSNTRKQSHGHEIHPIKWARAHYAGLLAKGAVKP